MPRIAPSLLTLCLLWPAPLLAQVPVESDPGIEQDLRGQRLDRSQEAWQEEVVELPPYPGAGADLLRLPVSRAMTAIEVFIDRASISLGADGVSRYTVVVTSSRGARNVVFEGLQCSRGAYRVYAFGDGRGAFGPRQQTVWQPVRGEQGAYSYRRLLGLEILCDQYGTPRTPAEAVHQLRYRSGADDRIQY